MHVCTPSMPSSYLHHAVSTPPFYLSSPAAQLITRLSFCCKPHHLHFLLPDSLTPAPACTSTQTMPDLPLLFTTPSHNPHPRLCPSQHTRSNQPAQHSPPSATVYRLQHSRVSDPHDRTLIPKSQTDYLLITHPPAKIVISRFPSAPSTAINPPGPLTPSPTSTHSCTQHTPFLHPLPHSPPSFCPSSANKHQRCTPPAAHTVPATDPAARDPHTRNQATLSTRSPSQKDTPSSSTARAFDADALFPVAVRPKQLRPTRYEPATCA